MAVLDCSLQNTLEESWMNQIRATIFGRFVCHSNHNALRTETCRGTGLQEIWNFFTSFLIFHHSEVEHGVVPAIHSPEGSLGLLRQFFRKLIRQNRGQFCCTKSVLILLLWYSIFIVIQFRLRITDLRLSSKQILQERQHNKLLGVHARTLQ